ncbi:protein kinase family protein [Virgibacillus flavescens]|uniref:protein kinase family protein n=1 Tax=Virgibacillus flavescens TaxID=1611422 RepID=UPI003D354922
MKSTCELVDSVKFKVDKNDVLVLEKDKSLEFIAAGRSAVVFKILSTNNALKVFFPNSIHLAKEEAEIYEILKGNPYFPTLYEAGSNYLLIDFIEGYTLFECLSQGILLTHSAITDTDLALNMARQSGLNPSDIHLRNIILTPEGNVKLIDVARFRQTKDCRQWSDLRKAFYTFYSKHYFPKKIPVSVMNTVAYFYKKRNFQVESYKKSS